MIVAFEIVIRTRGFSDIHDLTREVEPTRHGTTWGDDHGFSHLRGSILGPNITLPVHWGKLVLGPWQQIVVIDQDNNPCDRRIFLQVVGD